MKLKIIADVTPINKNKFKLSFKPSDCEFVLKDNILSGLSIPDRSHSAGNSKAQSSKSNTLSTFVGFKEEIHSVGASKPQLNFHRGKK